MMKFLLSHNLHKVIGFHTYMQTLLRPCDLWRQMKICQLKQTYCKSTFEEIQAFTHGK